MHKKSTEKSKNHKRTIKKAEIKHKTATDNQWTSALKQDPVTDQQAHVQTDYRQLK